GRHSRNEVGRVSKHHRRQDLFRNLTAGAWEAFVDERGGIQPIAVVVSALLFPQEIGIVASYKLDPAFGRFEILGEHPFVAVVLPHSPRNDYAGVAPAGDAGETSVLAERMRREIGKAPVFS